MHFICIYQVLKLLTCSLNTVAVVAIHNKNQALRPLVIVTTQGADFALAASIPGCELNVLVLHRLDVEADGWDCCDNFTEFQFVEDCCFSGSIEANHHNAHFLCANEVLPQLCERKSHCGTPPAQAGIDCKQDELSQAC